MYPYIEVGDSDQRAVLRTLVVSQLQESEKRRADAQTFALPLVPLQFSMNDYGRIFGVILGALSFLLAICLSSELSALALARETIDENILCKKCREYWFKILKGDQVLMRSSGIFLLDPTFWMMLLPATLMVILVRYEYLDLPEQEKINRSLADCEFLYASVGCLLVIVGTIAAAAKFGKLTSEWKRPLDSTIADQPCPVHKRQKQAC